MRKTDRRHAGTIVAANPMAYHAAAMTTEDFNTRPIIAAFAQPNRHSNPSRALQPARCLGGVRRPAGCRCSRGLHPTQCRAINEHEAARRRTNDPKTARCRNAMAFVVEDERSQGSAQSARKFAGPRSQTPEGAS